MWTAPNAQFVSRNSRWVSLWHDWSVSADFTGTVFLGGLRRTLAGALFIVTMDTDFEEHWRRRREHRRMIVGAFMVYFLHGVPVRLSFLDHNNITNADKGFPYHVTFYFSRPMAHS